MLRGISLRTVIIVLALAGMMAVALFLFNQGRTPAVAPAEPQTVSVGGLTLVISPDPNEQLRLDIQVTQLPVEPVPTNPPVPPAEGDVATATPIPPTQTPIVDPVPTNTPGAVVATVDSIILVTHTASAADTLSSVARQHKTTIALMAQFGVDQQDLDTAKATGGQLQIPTGNPAYCPANCQPHVIREGETTFRIAQLYGSTVVELQSINNLTNVNDIDLNAIMCVPVP